MANFRPFSWVKTPERFDGAHQTPDGYCVGIYVPKSTQSAILQERRLVAVDADGNPVDTGPEPKYDAKGAPPVEIPEHIAIVRPDGTNLMRMNDAGDGVVQVFGDLENAEPLEEHDHIPEARQNPRLMGQRLVP